MFKELFPNIEIYTLSNGYDALDQLKIRCEEDSSDYTNLVLLDIKMPGIDGFEFLDKLKDLSVKNKLSIAILTTSSHAKDKQKAENYDLIGYLQKPLSFAKMEEFVNNEFGRKEISC